MALWTCAGCFTHYAVGLPACPQCASTDHHEEGTMPKITVHGGPSNAWLVGEPGPELLDLPGGNTVQPEPEEEPSPGNSSETSSSKAAPSPKTNASAARSRARTTGSHSSKGRTASSTAGGTGGAQEDAASETADSEDQA